ncbi:OmpA family protein [Aquimarina sp. AU58]|uniref:OmpA family protein n=1 Tax=Aquimarina sp. AU58 TaxID=1874112 RepID=UPI000D6E6BD8|nr:OmpA family protein [Aquimarina sp. AU58]
MKKYLLKSQLIFAILLIGNTSVFCQQKKIEKAKMQYEKYRYIDARETYLKIVEKGYRSVEVFTNLGNTYYFNGEFEDALKWYKELVDSYPDQVEPEYYYRYAQSLKAVEKYEDSDIYMRKFAELRNDDNRAKLFLNTPDYLKQIEDKSDRYQIENMPTNSVFADFGTAFFGKYIVYSSSKDSLMLNKNIHKWTGEAFLDLFMAEYDTESSSFSKIKSFDKVINSKYNESTPVFTKDGKTIYFTRNNFEEGKLGRDQGGISNLKIYRSYKNDQEQWTTPQDLPFNSDEYSVAHPTLSSDEKTLYFSSDMSGGMGLSDLYKVTINDDGSFGEPKNLGDRINTEGKETFPFIGADNKLYFSSDGHMGLGGLDVYVTALDPQNQQEKQVINIGKPINSPKDDFAFIIDDNTKRGYFSSNRDGGKGRDDIYSLVELEPLRKEIILEGYVTLQEGVSDSIQITKVSVYDGKNNLIETGEVNKEGWYSYKVYENEDYFIKVEKDGYATVEKLVSTKNLSKTPLLIPEIILKRKVIIAKIGDDLGKLLSLNPIHFDFNDYLIRDDAKIELAKVIEIMQQYPNMKIEIRSHTDSRASAEYNKKLSARRAKKTENYIAIVGQIDRSRIAYKGFGEEELLNDCVTDSECSDEEHEKNRRSEFIIVQ